MSTSFLRTRNRKPWGAEPNLTAVPEFVPRTERDEARRAARDWLRERDEDNAIDFPDEYSEGCC